MRRPRPTASALALAALACLVLAGCDLTQDPGPRRTIDPSASPVIETDDEFCRALGSLQSEHQILREIRIRPGNRRALDDQFDEVDLAWDELQRVAPRGMSAQLRAMDWAVIELGLAVMDYTTTSRFEEAADHVLRRDIAFDRAVDRLRARTTCEPWAPTPKPSRRPEAAASPSPSPSSSASPSAATGG